MFRTFPVLSLRTGVLADSLAMDLESAPLAGLSAPYHPDAHNRVCCCTCCFPTRTGSRPCLGTGRLWTATVRTLLADGRIARNRFSAPSRWHAALSRRVSPLPAGKAPRTQRHRSRSCMRPEWAIVTPVRYANNARDRAHPLLCAVLSGCVWRVPHEACLTGYERKLWTNSSSRSPRSTRTVS